MRAAAVQLNSNGDKARNLAAAERLVRAAAADGAELVALPEKWNLLAGGEELLAGAEPLDGPSLDRRPRLGARARHPPARRQHLPSAASEKAFNTSVLIGPDGEDLAVYRKIHMFDVDAGGVSYRESEHEQPGAEIVTAPVGELIVGLTVCYDLRFPELFRILALRGARAHRRPLGLHRWPPAATTGRCCCGRGRSRTRPSSSPRTRSARRRRTSTPSATRRSSTPGASVLATAPDGECFVAADLDLAAQERVRESLPSLANRRPEAYAWPQLAEAHA